MDMSSSCIVCLLRIRGMVRGKAVCISRGGQGNGEVQGACEGLALQAESPVPAGWLLLFGHFMTWVGCWWTQQESLTSAGDA